MRRAYKQATHPMIRAATPPVTRAAPLAGVLMRRSVRAAACALSLTLGLFSITPATGADAPANTGTSRERDASRASPEDKAAAQALFDQGRELMKRGESAIACPRFEESDRLDSGLGTRYHLADCYEAIGKLASAHAMFSEIAAEAAVRGQTQREEVARRRVEELQPRLSKLAIEVPHPQVGGLVVARDGKSVGRPQWGLAVPVDPGVHRVEASGRGLVSWSTEVDVPSGPGVSSVIVPPLAAERRESFFDSTARKVGLGALGVGVGTLALGTVFAIQASSKNDDSNRAGCSKNGCPNDPALTLRRQALQAGNRATWAMGIGAVGLGAAAVLFWVLPDREDDGDEREGMHVSSTVDLRGAALRVEGRF